MAIIEGNIQDASTTSLGFGPKPLNIYGLTHTFVELIIDCTAANLITDCTLCGFVDTMPNVGNPLNLVNQFTPVTVLPVGFTFTNGYYLQVNNPAIGRSAFTVVAADIGKYLTTYHTYTSGGGTVRFRANVFGSQRNVTP